MADSVMKYNSSRSDLYLMFWDLDFQLKTHDFDYWLYSCIYHMPYNNY